MYNLIIFRKGQYYFKYIRLLFGAINVELFTISDIQYLLKALRRLLDLLIAFHNLDMGVLFFCHSPLFSCSYVMDYCFVDNHNHSF